MIALTTVGCYRLKMNAVLAFWIAYILTRPFGASMGDLLPKIPDLRGLGLGTTSTSAVSLVVIVGLLRYLTFRRKGRLARSGEEFAISPRR